MAHVLYVLSIYPLPRSLLNRDQYARSIRRYRILPTQQTPLFFNRDSFLVYRRADGQTYTPTLDETKQPNMTGQAEVPANDIQNDLEYVCPVKIGELIYDTRQRFILIPFLTRNSRCYSRIGFRHRIV